MKLFLASALFTFLITAGYQHYSIEISSDFDKWTAKYNMFYSDTEKIYRMKIYYLNKIMIEKHNQREDSSYQMGVNKFMTLTQEEFSFSKTQQEKLSAVDWRNYTKVKDQDQCNSGWAFSVSNLIDAWYAITKNQYISVSTQQLVTCDAGQGCGGGLNWQAMDYVKKEGLVSSLDYPYNIYSSTCRLTKKGYYFINDYQFVGTESYYLQQALNNYPVSVGVDASNWQFYKSGLFQDCSKTQIGHFALAVGYDSANNWIVQNSWGEGWGENGHIRLYPGNTCGILSSAYQIY